MAKADHTPWEPGVIVLPTTEIIEPNPYNGGVFAQHQLSVVAFILNQACYKLDSRVSLILKQSEF
ncbi:hypothetical protein uan_013 [Pseudomonas phage UAntarctica]|nr:hypothetical protein uan_013 [Pseudomonas phage UAntarctica]